ncbi:MAG: type transporter [Fibrobacteres bacterium]|nr:type transporter [Fibrobacterota bacterium]
MNLFRVIVLKEFQQLKRDKTSLRLMIMLPMIQMIVLGYALTTEVKHTPVAVLDHDGGPDSRSMIQAVSNNALFDFRGNAASESDLKTMLDRGQVKLGIIIPQGFSRQLENATRLNPGVAGTASVGQGPEDAGAKVQLWVDGQDANSAGVARGYLSAVLNQWAMRHLGTRLEASGIRLDQLIPIATDENVLFNPLLKSTWYMVPGIAVILVTMVTALLTGFSIVREKEAGTLEQLMVTPLKPIHVVVGKAVPFFIIGVVELMVALVIAQLKFQVPFRGNYLTLLAFTSAYMLSSLGIGIFTSTVARTQQQALFIIWFFLLFFMLLSGFFLPVENMPHWVQIVTLANPVRFFMHVLREMFLKGSGFPELWREGAAMLGIGFCVFTFSVLKFNRKTG